MSQDESRRATETISTADGHMIKARKLGNRHLDAFEAAMTLKPKAPQPVKPTPLPPGSGTQASSHVTQEEDQEQPEEDGSITESSSREAQQQPRSTTAAARPQQQQETKQEEDAYEERRVKWLEEHNITEEELLEAGYVRKRRRGHSEDDYYMACWSCSGEEIKAFCYPKDRYIEDERMLDIAENLAPTLGVNVNDIALTTEFCADSGVCTVKVTVLGLSLIHI